MCTARESPKIFIHPNTSQTVIIGQSVAIGCQAVAGIPSPTIKWKRIDGRPISSRLKEIYPGYLRFNDVSFDDAGAYECTAENVAGTVSATTTLTVHQSPTITLNPNESELSVTEGDELRLECLVEGLPAPTIEWEDSQQVKLESEINQISDNGRQQVTIQKYNVRRSDEGIYVCSASNVAGSDQKFITVLVKEKRGDVGKCLPYRILFKQALLKYFVLN